MTNGMGTRLIEDEDQELEPVPSFPWSWTSPLILLCGLVQGVSGSVTSFFGDMAYSLAGHANWLKDRKEFEMAASREIERIVVSDS